MHGSDGLARVWGAAKGWLAGWKLEADAANEEGGQHRRESRTRVLGGIAAKTNRAALGPRPLASCAFVFALGECIAI